MEAYIHLDPIFFFPFSAKVPPMLPGVLPVHFVFMKRRERGGFDDILRRNQIVELATTSHPYLPWNNFKTIWAMSHLLPISGLPIIIPRNARFGHP